MQAHATTTQIKYAQNATTSTHKAHSLDALRMAIEDKARGQRIAALRTQRRLTQQAMAERLGIAYRTYQTWEAGQVMPEWPNLEKLAQFFEIRPEDIIGETPDFSLLMTEGERSQLDRIEAALAVLESIDERLEALESRLSRLDEAEADPQTPTRPPARRPRVTKDEDQIRRRKAS